MKTTIIAAFDFDGTLTYRDTLLPFLTYTSGKAKVCFTLFICIPYFIGFCLRLYNRQQVKEALLKKCIGGMSIEEVKEKGELFATKYIQTHLNPKRLKTLQEHQELGHRCILVSANLDVYLRPWANLMGFQDLICSHVEVDSLQKVTGKLKGLNCWGEEKRQRLLKLLGPRQNFILYAYGNSRGDKEMLELSDYPFCY